VKVEDFLRHLLDPSHDAFGTFFNGSVPRERVELFAIAQHHGVPTGFLDWNFDPLIAVYFAAEDAAFAPEPDALALWALRRQLLDSSAEWPLARLTVQAGMTPLLDVQAGLFTWCPRGYLLNLERGKFVPFKELVPNWRATSGSPGRRVSSSERVRCPLTKRCRY